MRSYGVRRLSLTTGLFLSLILIAAVGAQNAQAPATADMYAPARAWDDDVPAHLSFVEGSVTLEREGRLEPAEANLALLAGDRIRTRTGRVEVLYADGSVVCLDEFTDLDMLSGSLVRLLTGRLHVSIVRTTAELNYRIDAPPASVWIRSAGEYRVDVRENRRSELEVDLGVIRGSAELVNAHGRTLVRAGTHAVATTELAPSLPYVANSAEWDEFDRWVDRQRAARLGTYSTRYLPAELRYYSGAFDNYGSWDYEPTYGYVWYPRVATGWRPYSHGRWSFTAHFGWFWIGVDRWSWPTHHYGRWGHRSGSWYWIPDRRWSPAWVSWATAPGYVGWCPLGFDGRPVYSFRHYDPWSAWTVLPSRVFVPNVWVTQHIVVPTVIAPTVRTQFIERPTAPMIATVRARTIEPIRAPTFTRTVGTAVPRNGQTAYAGEESWRRMSTGGAVPRGTTAGTRAGSDGRYAAQPDADARRAVPDRSRMSQDVNVQIPRIDVPRADAPRSAPDDTPRRAAPRGTPVDPGDAPSVPSRSGANSRTARPDVAAPDYSSGARPRLGTPSTEPRPSTPSGRSEPDRGASRVPDRAAPREPAPRYGGDSPRQSAPVQRTEPDRGPGRTPDRSTPRESPPSYSPSRPPAPAQPPPDRGPSRVPDRASPREAPPPPSAAPPPSRGRGGADSGASSSSGSSGGDGRSRAVPRGRGGGN